MLTQELVGITEEVELMFNLTTEQILIVIGTIIGLIEVIRTRLQDQEVISGKYTIGINSCNHIHNHRYSLPLLLVHLHKLHNLQ